MKQYNIVIENSKTGETKSGTIKVRTSIGRIIKNFKKIGWEVIEYSEKWSMANASK